MMLTTIGVVFPLVTSMGYDPVWFGILGRAADGDRADHAAHRRQFVRGAGHQGQRCGISRCLRWGRAVRRCHAGACRPVDLAAHHRHMAAQPSLQEVI